MGQIDQNIAYNLKSIRRSQNLSLDMLSERTGVSKSMLGQIERGESNPTVATVSKIMEGLKVSFEELIYRKEDRILAVKREHFTIYKEKEGNYKMQVVFPYSQERDFELFYMEIEEQGVCSGSNYGDNTWIYMMACKGSVNIRVEDEAYLVEAGDAIRFPAFKEYELINQGEGTALLYLILSHREREN